MVYSFSSFSVKIVDIGDFDCNFPVKKNFHFVRIVKKLFRTQYSVNSQSFHEKNTYIYIEFYYMGKQRKHNLIIDYECDYGMIGICSHHVDYRLVWGINEKLNLQLSKADDDFIVMNKKGQKSNHSLFEFKDAENLIEYYLIKNKNEGKFLIPEKQEIDYFLFLLENYQEDTIELIQKLKTVSSILAVFNFDPEEINSTENLIFN